MISASFPSVEGRWPCLRMPGHIAEDIAFVDLHGVGDLRAYWLDGRRVENLDDVLRSLNVPGSQQLSHGPMLIVIRRVALASEVVESVSSEFDVGVASVRKTQPKVGVGALGSRDAKSQIKQKSAGHVKSRIICPTGGGAPFGFGASVAEHNRHTEIIAKVHHDTRSKLRRKMQTKGFGQRR